MPDYTITLKIRSRKRNLLKDIDRIFKTGRFQERFEFVISEYITSNLRLAFLDVSEVDITTRFGRKRKQSQGVATNLPTRQTHTRAAKTPAKVRR
jgi:hypothetical protein